MFSASSQQTQHFMSLISSLPVDKAAQSLGKRGGKRGNRRRQLRAKVELGKVVSERLA